MSTGGKLAAALTSFLSFRVLMALATSTSVTAAVAGPMAYQAAQAREIAVVAAPAPTTTTTTAPARLASVTSTTTTTTTTTLPEPAAPGATTTTLPPLEATGLFVSPNVDHTLPTPLDGSRIFGTLFLYFDGPGATSVTYWIDDPLGAGTPAAANVPSPFDLAPTGFAVSALGVGQHTLLAEITTTTGRTRRLAEFTVSG